MFLLTKEKRKHKLIGLDLTMPSLLDIWLGHKINNSCLEKKKKCWVRPNLNSILEIVMEVGTGK